MSRDGADDWCLKQPTETGAKRDDTAGCVEAPTSAFEDGLAPSGGGHQSSRFGRSLAALILIIPTGPTTRQRSTTTDRHIADTAAGRNHVLAGIFANS